MPDSPTPTAAEPKPPADTAVAVVHEVERKDLVPTFVVRDHGKRYEVAANIIAHKAQQQLTVGRLYSLCEKALKVYEKDPELVPSPKELKVLAEAFALVSDMGDTAYGESKAGGQLGHALERLAYGLTRGAVEAGKQKSHSPEARLVRLSRVGKSRAKPETVDATVVDEAPLEP